MIVVHLLCHWRAYRRHETLARFLLRAARSLRVLYFRREHAALCALAVVREHIAHAMPHEVFHHLTHRGYLLRGLSPRRRVQCALFHYRYDEATFDMAWLRAVYRHGGLRLWQHAIHGSTFDIRLEMAARRDAEGDLTIALVADEMVLHRLSFSWVDGALFGVAAFAVPFIARNQGRWSESDDAYAAFEAAFPHNAASYFCFAALRGVAGALGMQQALAVNSAAHIAWGASAAPVFANAYDRFWEGLGGVPHDAACYRIALPFDVKPLALVPARHRQRAARRRAHWQAIAVSACAVTLRHRLPGLAHPTVALRMAVA